ncbi:MAG: hypothetical protein ACRD1R_10395 [Acidobacteriota bacterium]
MTKTGSVILWLVLLLIGFILGVILFYPELNRTRTDLQSTSQTAQSCQAELKLGQLRDLAGLMYFEATRQNFGVASRYSADYFNTLSEITGSDLPAQADPSLAELARFRDDVTGNLAQANPMAVPELQNLFIETYQRTNPAVEVLLPGQ